MGRHAAAAASRRRPRPCRALPGRAPAHAGLRRRGLVGWVAPHRVADERGHVHAVDVAFPALRLAVEIDGWAWHTDPARFGADRRAWNRLERQGWHLLHLTADDVLLHLEATLDVIETRVRELASAA